MPEAASQTLAPPSLDSDGLRAYSPRHDGGSRARRIYFAAKFYFYLWSVFLFQASAQGALEHMAEPVSAEARFPSLRAAPVKILPLLFARWAEIFPRRGREMTAAKALMAHK